MIVFESTHTAKARQKGANPAERRQPQQVCVSFTLIRTKRWNWVTARLRKHQYQQQLAKLESGDLDDDSDLPPKPALEEANEAYRFYMWHFSCKSCPCIA